MTRPPRQRWWPSTEFCGKADAHDYELYLAVNDIEHTKTKARHPQTNGICERFHKTVLQEFYQVAFRTKLYAGIDDLQRDLDAWINRYNNERTRMKARCVAVERRLPLCLPERRSGTRKSPS